MKSIMTYPKLTDRQQDTLQRAAARVEELTCEIAPQRWDIHYHREA